MARSNSFAIDIDVRAVEALAGDIARINPLRLGQVGVRAVNEVAVRSEAKARQAIVAGVNISDVYAGDRMGVRLADDTARPEAVIYAPFRHTQLGRYDPKQLTKAVKHPERSKGDPSRGIRPGLKGGGVSVEVIRGVRKPIGNAFTMPLRNGNGVGVFTRKPGDAKYTTRLGPSVYQLFRVQADLLEDEIGMDLAMTVIGEAERAVLEVFA